MKVENNIQLGLYDPIHDGNVITCSDYLQGLEAGTLTWIPNLADSTLFITTQEGVWGGEQWNLGDFRLVLQQLIEVKDRLDSGKPAILRSAVLEQPYVPYFLFLSDPQDGQQLLLSQFYILDISYRMLLPIDDHAPGESEKLYSYVRKNYPTLIAADPFPDPTSPPLRQVAFPYAALTAALGKEILLGEKVLSLLEKE